MIQLQHPFGKERTQSLSILVLGLGESGAAMVRWCINQGAKVSVADTRSENQLSENAKKYQQQVKDVGVNNNNPNIFDRGHKTKTELYNNNPLSLVYNSKSLHKHYTFA